MQTISRPPPPKKKKIIIVIIIKKKKIKKGEKQLCPMDKVLFLIVLTTFTPTNGFYSLVGIISSA